MFSSSFISRLYDGFFADFGDRLRIMLICAASMVGFLLTLVVIFDVIIPFVRRCHPCASQGPSLHYVHFVMGVPVCKKCGARWRIEKMYSMAGASHGEEDYCPIWIREN